MRGGSWVIGWWLGLGTGPGVDAPRIDIDEIDLQRRDETGSVWGVEVSVSPGNTHDYGVMRAELRVDGDMHPAVCEATIVDRCTFEVHVTPGTHEVQAMLTFLQSDEPTAGFASTVVELDETSRAFSGYEDPAEDPASAASDPSCSVVGHRFAGASWAMGLLWLGWRLRRSHGRKPSPWASAG